MIKAALVGAATVAATVGVLRAAGMGPLLWADAGWILAALPGLVLGCIVFEGTRVSGKR